MSLGRMRLSIHSWRSHSLERLSQWGRVIQANWSVFWSRILKGIVILSGLKLEESNLVSLRSVKSFLTIVLNFWLLLETSTTASTRPLELFQEFFRLIPVSRCFLCHSSWRSLKKLQAWMSTFSSWTSINEHFLMVRHQFDGFGLIRRCKVNVSMSVLHQTREVSLAHWLLAYQTTQDKSVAQKIWRVYWQVMVSSWPSLLSIRS